MVSHKPCWAPDHQHFSRGHLQGQTQIKSVLHPLRFLCVYEHNHPLKALYATPVWGAPASSRGSRDSRTFEKQGETEVSGYQDCHHSKGGFQKHEHPPLKQTRRASVLNTLVPALTKVGPSLGPHYAGEKKKRFI